MKVNWAILPKSVIVHFDGRTKNISSDTKLYADVINAIKNNKLDTIPTLIDVSSTIQKSNTNKSIDIRDGFVYIDGELVNNSITSRIIQYYEKGIPYNGLVEFWRNLKKNPSYSARERLFLFLENAGHPFTDDGHFIAYKGITSDFKDCHTQTIDNSIGSKPTMDRTKVDDNPSHTCSAGLHVASFGYVKKCYSSDRNLFVCVKVNPEHVVAIPTDYNNQKMRVCQYEVLSLCNDLIGDVHYVDPNKPVAVVELPSESSSESSSESELDENKQSEVDEDETRPPAFLITNEESESESESEDYYESSEDE